MKSYNIFLLLLVCLSASCQNYDPCEIACNPQGKLPYPVIISGGQSNAQGADPNNVPSQYNQVLPYAKVWENDNNILSDYDPNVAYNNSFLAGTMPTAIPLADQLSQSLGSDVIIFSVARGGTTLCDQLGVIDYNSSPQDANDVWHIVEQSWTKLVAHLATQGYYPDIQAGIWWQGFADGGSQGNPLGCSFSYYDNLSEFMFNSRNLYNDSAFPYFIMDSANTQTNNGNRVRNAKIQYSSENTNTTFIDGNSFNYIDPAHVDNATHIAVANTIFSQL